MKASSSARESLLPPGDVPTAVPVVASGVPAVPTGVPVQPQAMYREQVHTADGYWAQTLGASPGLVLRERLYLSQICCAACEKKTSYTVGALPAHNAGLEKQWLNDETMVAMLTPGAFEVREESGCCCRYCLHQSRELKLGYFAPRVGGGQPGGGVWEGGLAGFGWPEGEIPALWLERPFKCTLCCCCCLLNPQEMSLYDGQEVLGKALMEWDCCMVCWPYRRYGVLDAAGAKEYDVHVPLACADGCRNCCAPTCFNRVLTMPITAAGDAAQLGSLENHWPGCNCRGLCAAGMANNNYVVKFPQAASAAQKARLLSALHLIDFNFFERRANQQN